MANAAHALLGNEYGLLDDGYIKIADISGGDDVSLTNCYLQLSIKAPIGVMIEYLLSNHCMVRKQNKSAHYFQRMGIDEEHPGFSETLEIRKSNYISCYESVGEVAEQAGQFGLRYSVDTRLNNYAKTLGNYTDFAVILSDAHAFVGLLRECGNPSNSPEFNEYIDVMYHIAGKWMPKLTSKLFPDGLVYG